MNVDMCSWSTRRRAHAARAAQRVELEIARSLEGAWWARMEGELAQRQVPELEHCDEWHGVVALWIVVVPLRYDGMERDASVLLRGCKGALLRGREISAK